PVRSQDDVVGAVQLFTLPVRREDLAFAGGCLHHQRARDMLADVEIAGRVVGHAVTFVARVPHLDDALMRTPASADFLRHVAELEALLLRIPDRPFAETEPGAQLLDRRALVYQVRHVGVRDLNSPRHVVHSTDPSWPVRPTA